MKRKRVVIYLRDEATMTKERMLRTYSRAQLHSTRPSSDFVDSFEKEIKGAGFELVKKMGFYGHGIGKNGRGLREPMVVVIRTKYEGFGYLGGVLTTSKFFNSSQETLHSNERE